MATRPKHPASKIKWRDVKSSNVIRVGWDDISNLYVIFHGVPRDTLYLYRGVSRQRAVAMARATSVGEYLNRKIKPNYTAVKVA